MCPRPFEESEPQVKLCQVFPGLCLLRSWRPLPDPKTPLDRPGAQRPGGWSGLGNYGASSSWYPSFQDWRSDGRSEQAETETDVSNLKLRWSQQTLYDGKGLTALGLHESRKRRWSCLK